MTQKIVAGAAAATAGLLGFAMYATFQATIEGLKLVAMMAN